MLLVIHYFYHKRFQWTTSHPHEFSSSSHFSLQQALKSNNCAFSSQQPPNKFDTILFYHGHATNILHCGVSGPSIHSLFINFSLHFENALFCLTSWSRLKKGSGTSVSEIYEEKSWVLPAVCVVKTPTGPKWIITGEKNSIGTPIESCKRVSTIIFGNRSGRWKWKNQRHK